MTAKRKGKASEGKAAMAYMRRLHGDPDPSPVDDLADADYDLADLALGPEGEQTTDAPCAETARKKQKFPPVTY